MARCRCFSSCVTHIPPRKKERKKERKTTGMLTPGVPGARARALLDAGDGSLCVGVGDGLRALQLHVLHLHLDRLRDRLEQRAHVDALQTRHDAWTTRARKSELPEAIYFVSRTACVLSAWSVVGCKVSSLWSVPRLTLWSLHLHDRTLRVMRRSELLGNSSNIFSRGNLKLD